MSDQAKTRDSRAERYAEIERRNGPVTDSPAHQALFRQKGVRDSDKRAGHMIEAARSANSED